MRTITSIALLVFALACNSSKHAGTKSNPLNGTWLPIKQEIGGRTLPAAAFEKQKLVISDSNYTFVAESVDKGVVRYRDDKMDIYGKEGINTGKHFTAIFKLENGELTVCYNLAGDSYPEAYDTKSKPTLFVCVFKKEQLN